MTTFDSQRAGTGTHEWAEVTENIARGCPHNCLYCYAAQNAKRFKLRDRADWAREELTKRADITSYPARDGVIMFPSAHDITPFNLEACIRVARLMLEAGNKLLIVSKPRIDCISRVVRELADYKNAILFRFTIGTTDAATAAHWEPGAPTPAERIDALQEGAYDSSQCSSPRSRTLKDFNNEPSCHWCIGFEHQFFVSNAVLFQQGKKRLTAILEY